MAEQRDIHLNINAVQMTAIYEQTGKEEFFSAIGYLATWNMSFATCEIMKDRPGDDTDCDLIAVYKDDEGNVKYVIGAVWHDDHYGFHS